jgi:uncharacterized protein (DUF1501 family)
MFSRREFLKTSSLVSLSPLVPTVWARLAHAAAAAPDGKALVVIQLDGGNDGLNTVVPFADEVYHRSRDKLRLEPDRLHKLDDRTALHESMKAAKELFDDGRLAIVQSVGYPNPDRSHFRSMRIWQTARFDDAAHSQYGWLGRALDDARFDIGNEASAIYVGHEEVPVSLWGRRSVATAVSRADDLKLTLPFATRAATKPIVDTRTENLQQFVTQQLDLSFAAAERFARSTAATTPASYPDTQLATRLKLIAQLLRSGSQARVYYTQQSGYDTHAVQIYTHAGLLRELSAALKAFLDDLRGSELSERVVVLAFSEFGRRVTENASAGTDHGAAGPVLLAGTPFHGGLHGDAPNLADLDAGDVKSTTDFRQIYATLLDQWLEIPSIGILGEEFAALPLIRIARG